MLDLILKLLEKISELTKLRKDRRVSFYESNVAPLLDDFRRLHEQYLTNFRSYRQALASGSGSLSSTADEAISDRLLMMHQKFDLLEKLNRTAGFQPLAQAIRRYVLWEEFTLDPDTVPHNDQVEVLARAGFVYMTNPGYWMIRVLNLHQLREMISLRVVDQDRTVGRAIDDIDRIVAELQQRYAEVIEQFEAARQQLIGEDTS